MNIYAKRIKDLQQLMRERNMDAYIILTDDFHASEYSGEYFKCREFISGFTGSAGTVVVTLDEARLWTDGRYFIQAAAELKDTGIELMKSGEKNVPKLEEYLKGKLKENALIGYDGRTVSYNFEQNLIRTLGNDINIARNEDLVGMLWQDRPDFPKSKTFELDVEYAGESRADKLERIRERMVFFKADAFLMAALDDICWLYNIRGDDIAFSPLKMSYSLVFAKKAVLYIDVDSLSDELRGRLNADGVEIKSYFDIYYDLKNIAANMSVMADLGTSNVALINCLPKGTILKAVASPATLFKAVKNPTEMDNIRKAHIIDGVAVTKHIYRLKKHFKEGMTELEAAKMLFDLRKQGEGFIEESFAPIIATGEHGAIVHYEPTKETDIPIKKNTFLLMDTGGHYTYGTTDITRTIAIGEVDELMKKRFTAVLKGNLRLAAARFKQGVQGSNLDVLAREPLWEMGLDFNHGTGHGVGYLLNVHEGPQNIGPRSRNNLGAFVPGMLTSDEPGLYIENAYGIRLENLMLCVPDTETEFGTFNKFETVTMVPFDLDGVMESELTTRDKLLLNNYHKKVYETISPYLDSDEKEWLKNATREVM